jgi:hypothetical protein
LVCFMDGAQVGAVSGNPNSNTGIRFRRNGNQIEILVWDSISNQDGTAYYWPMTINSLNQTSQSGYQLQASDSVGQIYLSGNVGSNNIWTGTVQFQNQSGAQGTLGSFSIPAQLILQ